MRKFLAILLLCAAPVFATVSDTSLGRVTYIGVNGSQTVFSFFYPASSLSDVVATVTLGTAGAPIYFLNADQIANPGGTVTFLSAPTAGATVKIERVMNLDQTLSISPYFPFPARAVERNYDRGTLQIQQVQRGLNDLAATVGAGGGGSGVTSVGLSMPGMFSVTGSPLIAPGTISVSLTAQAKNTFLGGPTSGSNATPTFRLLTAADFPAAGPGGVGGVFGDAVHIPILTIGASGLVTTASTSSTQLPGVNLSNAFTQTNSFTPSTVGTGYSISVTGHAGDGSHTADDGAHFTGGVAGTTGTAGGAAATFVGGAGNGSGAAGPGFTAIGGATGAAGGSPAAVFSSPGAHGEIMLSPMIADPVAPDNGEVWVSGSSPNQAIKAELNGKKVQLSAASTTCSVLGYGADPTGALDAASAISSALSDASCSIVYMPKGTYTINSGVSIPQFKSLRGDGPQSAVLNYSGTGCAITVDSVQGTVLSDFRINTSNIGANVCGILYGNTTAANLRNVARNVQVWSAQNPPVATQYGIYIHSTTANSMYYNQFDHIDVNLWGKGVYCLGDAGSAGCNANKFIDPEINASTVGFDFQGKADGLANSNTVYGLHCNGAGVATDQTCLSIGDGTFNVGGNYVDLYADNAVGGHAGKSWQILAGSLRNKVVSFTSGNTLGTNGNSLASDRNVTLELNAVSGRNDFRVGNVQLLSDSTVGGIYISPSGGSPAIFQSNATNIANNVAAIFKSNTQLASAGDILWAWQNNSGFTNSSDLHGGAGTNASGIDLNGAHRFAGQTFANLNNPGAPPNGTFQFCSDCTTAPVCAAGGTGAFATRVNGAWACAYAQSNPFLYATQGTGVSIPDATTTTLNYTTVVTDTDSAYNFAGGGYVIPANKGGTYQTTCQITWSTGFTSPNDSISIYVNGTPQFAHTVINPSANSSNTVSGIAVYAPGDAIRCKAFQDSGAAVFTTNAATTNFITVKRLSD
jgi:hypothetical protein